MNYLYLNLNISSYNSHIIIVFEYDKLKENERVIGLPIRIFIDQGHNPGTINAGAEGFGLREQDITYNVGVYLADLLNQDPNFDARLSRNSPTEVLGTTVTSSLAARVKAANDWPADYFISIHVNSNDNPAINGTEVYVYEENSQAYYLGEYILNSIVNIVGTRDNQVRVRPSLYVLRRTTMPSLLVELAYISNPSDVEKLRNDQWLFAYAIYLGLVEYFGLEPIQV